LKTKSGDNLALTFINNLARDLQKDLGSMRGWACGTILEAHYPQLFPFRDHQLFHFSDHCHRLWESAERLRIPFWASKSALEWVVTKEVRKVGFSDSLVSVRISRGLTDDSVNPSAFFCNRALLFVSVFQGQHHTAPIRLVSQEYRREYPDTKHTNYLFAELEYQELFLKKIDEILYLDPDSRAVLECARKNIGFVFPNEFILPPAGDILEGITMKIMMRLASKNGFPVVRRSIRYDDLLTIVRDGGSMIAMSTTGVVPVEELDGIQIPTNENASELCDAFNAYRLEYYESGGVNEIKP